MKRIIFSLIALLAFSLPALAQKADPLSFRRTLFVPVGQDMLILEAPRDMCFLDETRYEERQLFHLLKEETSHPGQEFALAFFAPCMDIAGAGQSSAPLPVTGTVSWLNPVIGPKTGMGRTAYLNTQETPFREYVWGKLKQFEEKTDAQYSLDRSVQRSNDGLSISYGGELKIEEQDYYREGIVATTTLKELPLAFSFVYTSQERPDTKTAQSLMNKFIAQQIALNE